MKIHEYQAKRLFAACEIPVPQGGIAQTPQEAKNVAREIGHQVVVKAVLVNIFGGMARADVIARGIVEAFKQRRSKFPVVVRLTGTNVAEGERILAESGLNLIRAASLYEAAEKAIAAAAGKFF